MLDSASPRNPSVLMLCKSSACRILLVVCLKIQSFASSSDIPHPLSLTRINSFPAFLISTSIAVAPASSAFSTSSLTTLAGRSITSPAAILLMMSSDNWMILVMVSTCLMLHYHSQVYSASLSPVQLHLEAFPQAAQHEYHNFYQCCHQ